MKFTDLGSVQSGSWYINQSLLYDDGRGTQLFHSVLILFNHYKLETKELASADDSVWHNPCRFHCQRIAAVHVDMEALAIGSQMVKACGSLLFRLKHISLYFIASLIFLYFNDIRILISIFLWEAKPSWFYIFTLFMFFILN